MAKILNFLLIFICLIAIFGGVVYYLYSLNNLGVAISLILAIIVFIIIYRVGRKYNINNNFQLKFKTLKLSNFPYLSLVTCHLLLVLSCFYILFVHSTNAAIISPWQVVSGYFFAFYGLATAILFILVSKNKITPHAPHPLSLIFLHYFLSFSVALIIYKIGYGFDSFIHRATVGLIDKVGSVDPKPFYYLGQYALVEIIHKITFLPINWPDKFLVPVLSALYLPLFIFKAAQKWFGDKKTALLTAVILLALPFSFFIVTTPQNLAYLFLLITIILGLTCGNVYELAIIFIVALAALIIHPIAGIPALLFALALSIKELSSQLGVKLLKKYFYLLIFILSAISLPAIFYFLNKDMAGIPQSAGSLQNILPSFNFTIPDQENFILNFIYLYGFNLKIIIFLMAIAGIILIYRHRREYKKFSLYLLMAAALGLSYLLTKFLPFDFLVNYERENYSDRVLLMAAFFLLPFILLAVHAFIDKILKQSIAVKIIFFSFFALFISASLYLSYPRLDRYFNSRGYSTSQNDINAVRWIEENHQKDYIVLANQQTSAAALREFGFKKYYQSQTLNDNCQLSIVNCQLFYYPLPTGGPLYQYYLDMVYKKPSRAAMFAAMDLAGVNEGYFVLNKYWWAFAKVLEEAKLEADSWREIGNGEIYVFIYNRE